MCRIGHAREWSTRILHELKYHDSAIFLTLTYSPENLPKSGTLVKADLQKFFKRVRKQLEKTDRKIKYYACGEYGDRFNRPHYHAIVFGLSLGPDDQALIKNCWTLGYIKSGTVTYDSARYVADYVQKKYSGPKNYLEYERKGLETPFAVMSQGIGLQYVMDYQEDLIKNMSITIHGAEVGIPRYYKKKMCLTQEESAIAALSAQERDLRKFIDHTEDGNLSEALRKRREHKRRMEDETIARSELYKKKSF